MLVVRVRHPKRVDGYRTEPRHALTLRSRPQGTSAASAHNSTSSAIGSTEVTRMIGRFHFERTARAAEYTLRAAVQKRRGRRERGPRYARHRSPACGTRACTGSPNEAYKA